MTEAKRVEFAEVRAKIRAHPDEVEAWSNKEIEKLTDGNIKGLIQNLKDKGPSTTTSFRTESGK